MADITLDDNDLLSKKTLNSDDRATDEQRKLFIGNLSWDTTEETFERAFIQFGEVEIIDFKRDQQGKPRGFGFVTFKNAESAQKVIANELLIDSRKVDPVLALPRSVSKVRMATVTEPSPLGSNRSKRLYVAHIGEYATEAEMRTLFSAYGTIVEIQMVKDHQTGKQKGFCFITYEHEDQADLAYNDRDRITYNSKPIEVRLAEPRKSGPPSGLNNVRHPYKKDKDSKSGGRGRDRSRSRSKSPPRHRDRDYYDRDRRDRDYDRRDSRSDPRMDPRSYDPRALPRGVDPTRAYPDPREYDRYERRDLPPRDPYGYPPRDPYGIPPRDDYYDRRAPPPPSYYDRGAPPPALGNTLEAVAALMKHPALASAPPSNRQPASNGSYNDPSRPPNSSYSDPRAAYDPRAFDPSGRDSRSGAGGYYNPPSSGPQPGRY